LKQALKQLLDALDEVSKTHSEVSDAAAREAMTKVIYQGFVLRKDGYKLPLRPSPPPLRGCAGLTAKGCQIR
jgi:hypothetical protein